MIFKHILVCFTIGTSILGAAKSVEEIPIGTIFSMWDDYKDVFTAMQYALERQHNDTDKLFQFKLYADNIKTVDAYKLTRIICRQFERGIYALMGTVDPESFDTLHSYANAFEMPFVTPWFPESVYHGPKDSKQNFAIQIRPEYHEGLVDLITYYGWTKVIYIYSDFDGLLRLQRIYRSIPKSAFGAPRFNIEIVKKVSSSAEAIEFLLSLERQNRESVKHVVLDCASSMAKDIVVQHVRSVHLGRRNFHYLMSGLVLDDYWDSQMAEYGAVNVTGLRLVRPDSDYARQFLRRWRQLDHRKYPAAGNQGISASGALAYDAVNVLEAGFRSLMQQKPNMFRHSRRGDKRTKGLTCDMSGDERQIPWEHGSTIAKALKSVQIEGLTGPIRFNDEGRRTNFSFDVVEMTPGSQLVKIGSWSDTRRLQLAHHTTSVQREFFPPPRTIENKTYIMTTVMEPPFMMYRMQEPGHVPLHGNDRFEGYSKDLAMLLAKELDINFEIRPVRDGKYGHSDSSVQGGWTGAIGELVRREAEIAVAPLTIDAQREQVVDFSKPFMSAGISIMIKKPNTLHSGFFSFMTPLSREVWMCLLCAYLGVSIVMFLVSRFSPCEWRIEETVSGTRVKNPFSINNSLWFALGTFMHQFTDIAPRSLSGRLVGGAWWFFSLIIVASYTANLAAFLTVEKMAVPINSADDLAHQSAIEYGAVLDGSTVSFFKNTKISVYARMWEFMASRPYVFVNSTQDGADYVRESNGRYAFLVESAMNDYLRERFPCDLMRVGKNLDYKGYGVAIAKGSGLQDSINRAILNLKASGALDRLQNKWWYEHSECKSVDDHTRPEFTLANVVGIFFILAAVLVVAMFMAMFEFCYKSNSEAKRAKTTLSDAMKNKARLALSTGRDVDSVRFYGDSSAL